MSTSLGEFEQLVMLALMRLGDDAYGVTVQRELAKRAKRQVSLATVYTTLVRLEAKELVGSRLGEPTPQRGGRRKKHYFLEAAGRNALADSLRRIRKMASGLDTAWDA
ncbi:MAG: PadR family transcriptional regulator [Gemmatimonadota bacterium]|nr:PadR family transcriptional regulator [Gemmatimonadota bacterium]